jgi:hypothetical protein
LLKNRRIHNLNFCQKNLCVKVWTQRRKEKRLSIRFSRARKQIPHAVPLHKSPDSLEQ